MTWIKSATFDGDGTVRITQITYTGSEHSWFIKTIPQGNWNELVFDDDDDVTLLDESAAAIGDDGNNNQDDYDDVD